jgi:hypothetical protein
MSLRYRKRIRLPFGRLNLSRSGALQLPLGHRLAAAIQRRLRADPKRAAPVVKHWHDPNHHQQ